VVVTSLNVCIHIFKRQVQRCYILSFPIWEEQLIHTSPKDNSNKVSHKYTLPWQGHNIIYNCSPGTKAIIHIYMHISEDKCNYLYICPPRTGNELFILFQNCLRLPRTNIKRKFFSKDKKFCVHFHKTREIVYTFTRQWINSRLRVQGICE